MRLSDAIALGRVLLRPSAYTTIWDGEGCALGMAFAALGCKTHDEAMVMSTKAHGWRWLKAKIKLPCNCKNDGFMRGPFKEKSGSGHFAIVHLFNEHVCGEEDWTLDQLIDWVRSVEPEETSGLPEAVAIEEARIEVCEKHLTGAGAGHEL